MSPMWSQAGKGPRRRKRAASSETAFVGATVVPDRECPCVRIGLAGLSERNFDLLPALARDVRARVCWVQVRTLEEPLAQLAEMLGFPVVRLASEEEARESPRRWDVELIVVPGTEPARHAGAAEPRLLFESELRALLDSGIFRWERVTGRPA